MNSLSNTDADNSQSPASRIIAQRFTLTGRVQGVGFRPFVYRLAHRYKLQGWIKNLAGQVIIEVQGLRQNLIDFQGDLLHRAPQIAAPIMERIEAIGLFSATGFHIKASDTATDAQIHVPPDYFTCPDCLREMHAPDNRRYGYAFINCTQCGPRYTLIKSLPYDRQNTTMAEFDLCPQCREEYHNPLDRRFHAEPMACPKCGPQLLFHSTASELITADGDALHQCVTALRAGAIVAVKGIGGYHLMCDANRDDSVIRLRNSKPRPHKPLAVMFPQRSPDPLQAVRETAELSLLAEHLLLDSARPIVLVKQKSSSPLSIHIAPGLDEVGVFLPYSPLHTLILEEFDGPLVATSANFSGEPVLTDNTQVEQRLSRVAEGFLHHNRAIQRPADDSVYRIIANTPRPIRLGRGLSPLELQLPFYLDMPLLAVGGQMKNTVALAWGNRVVISPHIGDLNTPLGLQVFTQVINDLQSLYRIRSERIICDAHTGYTGTRWARRQGPPVCFVYHHHAHASAVAGEFPHEKRWLVFTWDGTGLGEDGTLWGGETLYGSPGLWQRVASQRAFHLPGGEKAGLEPWRSALALCWETPQLTETLTSQVMQKLWPAPQQKLDLLFSAWQHRRNTPQSSAVGRLFDAAAALTGICTHASFEGQGPMQLEAVAAQSTVSEALPLAFEKDMAGIWRSDWSALIPMLADESHSQAHRAACFHHSLAESLIQQCRQFKTTHGDFAVGLNGGVFQNKLLTERIILRLKEEGFRVYLPVRLPCSDGGLCFGQIVEAAQQLTGKSRCAHVTRGHTTRSHSTALV